MNLAVFAKMYLDDAKLFDKSSIYEGMLGDSVMELIETLRSQQHSGNSIDLAAKIFLNVIGAYRNPDHPIWKKWERTEEGKKFLEENGITPDESTPVPALPEDEVKILLPTHSGIIRP